MPNLDQMTLFGRSNGPSELCKSVLRKWALQSCFTASFFSSFLHRMSVLREQSVCSVRREKLILVTISLFFGGGGG